MNQLEFTAWAADRVEWMLLSNGYEEISRGDLQAENAFLVREGATADTGDAGNDQISDQLDVSKQIEDCFDHLQYRAKAMENVYAFSIESDVISRSTAYDDQSDFHLVYRFILACSRPDMAQRLGSTFSSLCKVALSRFLGARASVWNVDANSSDRQPMGTTTRAVAEYLAPFLGATPHPDFVQQLAAQGDGGVDLIACVGFGDGAPGHLTIFGQCAASSRTEYWRDKLVQPERFARVYRWTSEPVLALFIPVVYRKNSGHWLNDLNVGRSLLFDRIRILNSLRLHVDPLPDDLRVELNEALAKLTRPPSKPRKRARR
jgi:hypothetical protein